MREVATELHCCCAWAWRRWEHCCSAACGRERGAGGGEMERTQRSDEMLQEVHLGLSTLQETFSIDDEAFCNSVSRERICAGEEQLSKLD
ncbi:hypothetical protein MRB53_009930 [Persea americana]|uniref:Uncharacterized protein n=1 Tax=Persea americana TaxID=3435 RepID=A0ACC2LQG8_PERAE|nr:hypothetical protein MRB53_009930 [Persea americana]